MAQKLKDFRQGDTYQVKITVTGQDVTGWLFTLTLKTNQADAVPALQVVHTGGSGGLDDAANGVAVVTVDSVTSAALTPGAYYYDLQYSIPGSPPVVRTVLPPVSEPFQKLRVVADAG